MDYKHKTYKFKNDFSPIVCPPKVVIDKEVTRFVIGDGGHNKVRYGILERNNEYDYVYKDILTDELVSVNKRFVVSTMLKRFVEVVYDMTANHNFREMKHCFYTMSIYDDYVIAKDNEKVEEYEKPNLIAIFYGDLFTHEIDFKD